jgi:hypothetical protein
MVRTRLQAIPPIWARILPNTQLGACAPVSGNPRARNGWPDGLLPVTDRSPSRVWC